MKNFKQYINESNIDKIKEECKDIDPDIDYSSSNWKEEFIDNVDWDYISDYKKLSEDFIEYFKDYVDWGWISRRQKLSESFVEKYKDNVDWDNISRYQKLSKSFIEKYKNKINFRKLFYNENTTNKFIFDHIQWFINEDIKNSWRFKDKEFKDKFNKYKKSFKG